MFAIALIYGLLAGTITIATLILGFSLSETAHLAGQQLIGYLVMILALSLIFVGVKRFRDREQGGTINFVPALMLGLMIAIVAGVVYMLLWEVYLAVTDNAFFAQYSASLLADLAASGGSQEEIAKLETELAAAAESYANPLYRLPITFLEIFPVGLVVAAVAAALLRNPRFLPRRA